MKSRIKILSGLIMLSLVFIAGIEAKAQGTSKWIELKKKGWVRAVYSVDEDMTVVEAFNLTIREAIDKDIIDSFRMNVYFQVPGKGVTAPEMVRIIFDSQSWKGRFSDRRHLTVYSDASKIGLTATKDVHRSDCGNGRELE